MKRNNPRAGKEGIQGKLRMPSAEVRWEYHTHLRHKILLIIESWPCACIPRLPTQILDISRAMRIGKPFRAFHFLFARLLG